MAAEAAVLGTPSIRFNDFVGKIGYLEELEKDHGLTIGIKTTDSDKLIDTVKSYLSDESLKETWKLKREGMLEQKIDTAKFLTWFIEYYPQSAKTMKENSEYQNRFK